MTPDQRLAAVSVTVDCDVDDIRREHRTGSGVMVSDWQVLTALHVVDCISIPTIHVATEHDVWRFAPEKEWKIPHSNDGIARIQMASGDHLSPRLRPPLLRLSDPDSYDPLYLQAGSPRFEERMQEASGWTYGGGTYGAVMITYRGPTEEGNSGAGVYDMANRLVAIHLGHQEDGVRKYGMLVTPEMVPHP